MSTWQRWTRTGLAAGALALTAVVATQFRPRPAEELRPVERTDPKANVESTNGRSVRINVEREEVRIEYEKLLGYDDGSTRMFNVTVVTTRAEGRTFTLTAKEGRAGKDDLDLALSGDVHLKVSDGLEVVTSHATYSDADGMVRADEAVTFSRGRMSGAGVGMTYAKNTDILTVLDQAMVHFTRAEEGADATDITAGSAQFDRPASTIRLERRMKLVSGSQVTEADAAVGTLTESDQELTSLDLRGRSSITRTTGDSAAQPSVTGRDIDITYAPGGRAIERLAVRTDATITATAGGPGAFRSVKGQDIDIRYGAGGEAIERTVVTGEAAIGLAGEPGQPGRQITARTVDVTLAPDGVTPTQLVARDTVRLMIPPEGQAAGRTIASDLMEAKGRAPEGLTSARFSGHVQYDERGTDISRSARSQVLETTMSGGLGTLEDATFSRGVKFDERTMSASASAARYVPGKGVLELTGSEPGFLAPHLSNERLDLGATRIDVVLEGPRITAKGRVGSTLRPQSAATDKSGKASADRKAPSMLKADQDVQVTADELVYDGQASTAVYTGNASLWQGDTKIRSRAITLDDNTGNLTALGGVTTTAMVLQGSEDGRKTRVLSKATATELHYVESLRRATYSGDADLTDPQGELKASTIALFLTASGEEIERIEARQQVQITVVENHRVATGDELDYFAADERYQVRGKPVTILDECGRKNEGLTLTFFRAVDRILLGGGPQNPTQTRSDGAACP